MEKAKTLLIQKNFYFESAYSQLVVFTTVLSCVRSEALTHSRRTM